METVVVVEKLSDGGWRVSHRATGRTAVTESLGLALDLAVALTAGRPARIVVRDDADGWHHPRVR